MAVKFSVIVPVYKEEKTIDELIAHLEHRAAGVSFEIIISDGCAGASTLEAVNTCDMKSPDSCRGMNANNVAVGRVIEGASGSCRRGSTTNSQNIIKLRSRKGRAAQMNAAASIAQGETLLFLHADTKLPENAFTEIAEALNDPAVKAGAFRLNLDSENLFLKFVSFTASLKSRLTGIAGGDQAIFIRKDYFDSLGGFKDIPLMEDTELMKRIKINNGRTVILNSYAVSSARKWEKDGIFFNTAKNHLVRLLYAAGVSPQTLYRIYYGG